MDAPRLSVILLTWNEERNVGLCLASLARQTVRDFEVLVVDAASTDGTLAIVRRAQPFFPVPLRLETATRRLPIGEARNLGVARARAPLLAFLSADAEAERDWVARMLDVLEAPGGPDLVFSRQVHAPHRWSVGAAVRGLRYHFPDGAAAEGTATDGLRYASNVAAAGRTEVLRRFPFDPATSASEDVLLAARAVAAGHRLAYEPRMVVHHHDVDGARQELRKCLREGEACGRYSAEIGVQRPLLAWAALLGLGAALLAVRPRAGLVLLPLALWAPALRRAARRRREMPARALVVGAAASPPFDLAFLGAYARGLLLRRRHRRDAGVRAAAPLRRDRHSTPAAATPSEITPMTPTTPTETRP